HYLLTGKPPYDGPTVMAILLKHRDGPIPSLRAARPEIPAALDAIFQRMMAKKLEERFASMAEVARALEALTKSEIANLKSEQTGLDLQPAVPSPTVAAVPLATDTTRAADSGDFVVDQTMETMELAPARKPQIPALKSQISNLKSQIPQQTTGPTGFGVSDL